MPFHADIPHFPCLLRSEYVYDGQEHHGEYLDVIVFAVDSVAGRAIGFDCMTSFGAQFARLPISAFCWKEAAPEQPLDHLELWNNFSYSVEAHEYEFLSELRCSVLLKDKEWYPGTYMFTLSWYGNAYSERAGDTGFKRAHIIKLDNGNFAAQPNNRIKWFEPSFVTEPFPEKPDFKTNSRIWNVEQGDKWVTENNDRFFYKVQERKS